MPVTAVLTRNDGNAPPANGRVRQWLSRAGLGEYRDAFARASEREFTELGMVDFHRFGVVDVAHKQTLFRLIKNLHAEGVACEKETRGDAPPSPTALRASLLDVHAAEHEEFLLSPALKPGASPRRSPFAPSPAEDDPERDEKDAKPLEQLRRLSREARHGAVERSAATADETVRDVGPQTSLEEVPAKETTTTTNIATTTSDPAKTPFAVSPVSVRGAGGSEEAKSKSGVSAPPLASLPADQPRIRVVVRKRPLNAKERARDEEDVVTVDRRASAGEDRERGASSPSPSSVTVWEPRTKVDLTQYTEEHAFAFDDAFPPEVDNDEVYRTTVAPLVGTVFDKCKVTCFAYGQTGSGKTYTMNPLPIRAAREILGELERRARSRASDVDRLRLHVSFFEIYGGKVYDLLNGRAKLVIREDSRAQMCVVGLKEFEVSDVCLVEQLIAHGTAARCVGSTGANAESSRSHAIMQFVLKRAAAEPTDAETRRVPASVVAQRLKTAAGANHEAIHGKVSFIDLAGSERGADTSENDRQTRLEGAEINKSLLALKECIRALDRGTGHVPFRGSKLTEVLRDSFMGDSRTVMIANVSPATGSCEHTLNTLRYAYRVKELRDGAEKTTKIRSDADSRASEKTTERGAGAGEISIERRETNDRAVVSSRVTRFAADGVTPVGAPAAKAAAAGPDASQSHSRDVTSVRGEKPERGTAAPFDPRAAAKAAAARVRDATRRSAEAEAERLAEKKRGAAAFLTKGGGAGGAGGAAAAGLLSPRGRKERPKSAAPGGASLRAGAKSSGAAHSGSPTKDASARGAGAGAKPQARRPQTARPRSDVAGAAPASGPGRGGGFGARASLNALGSKDSVPDPRTTAFDPATATHASGAKPASARLAQVSAKELARRNEEASTNESETKSAEKDAKVSADASASLTLRPLRGSALAAAKAHAHLTGVGPPVPQEEMAQAHDALINVILEEEEAVIAAHRAQIESAMALVKKEMALLAEVDKPGSAIDAYVERLARVLEQKQAGIEALRDKVRAFQTHLKEEEVLSEAVGLR